MYKRRSIPAVLALAATFAGAEVPYTEAPPRLDVTTLLNIDATRAQKVQTILQDAHYRRMALQAQMQLMREETDKQLATVLSPEELAKLKEAFPRPRAPMR
jgi:hypothetical protein